MKLGNISAKLQNEIDLWSGEKELARRVFKDFVKYTKSDYDMQWFHELLCDTIQKFIEGDIKKLMIFLPPQHGKSELVSRRLPAMMLGLNPNLKVAGCSYGATLAKGFNRAVKRCINSLEYKELFPNTLLNENGIKAAGEENSSSYFEIVGKEGFYKSVGVGGGLTGTAVDCGIIDDVIKDAKEADSLTYRNNIWDWYISVFASRLHNRSQQLLTFTRWHEDDLAGRILADTSEIGKGWTIVSLQGIKEGSPTETDHRTEGEALWEDKHSAAKIKSNPPRFYNALYQQNPKRTTGGLCVPQYQIVEQMPTDLRKIGMGMDFGWNHPTTLVQCGIKEVEKEMHLYVDEVVYGRHLENKRVCAIIAANNPKAQIIHADSADPKTINDLINLFRDSRIPLRIEAAKKGNGSISDGLRLLNGCKVFITRRSVNLKNELDNYSYVDLGGGRYSDTPIDDFNHAIDALRYYALATIASRERKAISYSK